MAVFGYALLITAAFCGLLIGTCAIYLRVLHYAGTYRVVHRLHRLGRVLFRGQFERHLRACRGTVIFEYPTLGWRVLRVWWTPDDVHAVAGAAGIPGEGVPGAGVPPFEIWCHDTYLDLDRGKAFIVPYYLFGAGGRRFIRSLGMRFPEMKHTYVCSAAVQFFRATPSDESPLP